jgi:phage-related protein
LAAASARTYGSERQAQQRQPNFLTRVLFGFYEGMLIALHAFIKKTQKTPPGDLAMARQRMKELLS